jgi:Family of unknown function (DUF5681)
MAERKVIGRPFQKGQSGNPSGRSKATHTISQLAKAYTEEAIEKLTRKCSSPCRQTPGCPSPAAHASLGGPGRKRHSFPLSPRR